MAAADSPSRLGDRHGRYRAADAFRAAAEESHRQAQARREASIDRCPRCGGWRMHPQPGDGWRGKVAGRRRPARHICPNPSATDGRND